MSDSTRDDTTNDPNTDAYREFNSQRVFAAASLEALTALIASKADSFRAEGGKNWGYVGDMNHINDLLERALRSD